MISNVNLSKTILVTLPFCAKLLETEKTTIAKLVRNLPTNLTLFLSRLDYHSVKHVLFKMGIGLIAAFGIKM